MTPLASTRTLLEHAIDYAGTFPPSGLPMPEALAQYTRGREGSEAWLLGRLVVPAGGLDELDAILSRTTDGDVDIAVVMGADAAAPSGHVAAFNARENRRARIVSAEFPPTAPADLTRLAGEMGGSIETFFETPLDDDLERRLDAIARAGAAAKVRTGGTVATAIPPPSSLARFLQACAERGLAFKATAGLHHALRSCYSLTYEHDSATAVMHGFLNVAVAAALARAGASATDIVEALTEPSATAFDFLPDRLVYRHSTTPLQDLAGTRRFFRSFGSCSFREPVEELTRLQLV